MAEEKITGLPNEAVGIGENDLMLISKETAPATFESQKINPNNLFYDSGNKKIPIHNGVYGLAENGFFSWVLHPSIRIVNRTVFIKGIFILPLATNNGAQGLDIDGSGYDSSPQSSRPWLYQGLAGGFAIATNGTATSQSPILPSVLWPDRYTTLNDSFQGYRSIKITNAKRFPLQSFISRFDINNTGQVTVVPTISLEGNGNAAFSITSPFSELNSVYNSGDFFADYSNYRSGFAGATNLRQTITAGETSPITIDARESADLGGFYLPINSQYQIDINTPMDLIIAAFDAL